MTPEVGTRTEFKRHVLESVLVMVCQGGHVIALDPEWLRGGSRPLWICGHCHIEFGRIYQRENKRRLNAVRPV